MYFPKKIKDGVDFKIKSNGNDFPKTIFFSLDFEIGTKLPVLANLNSFNQFFKI